MAKWSDKTMINFIELYQSHECLWNTSSNKYKDREARDNACKAIARDMAISNFEKADVVKKIKSIRTIYKRERAAILRSVKSGAGDDDLYTPSLVWFDLADSFLREVVGDSKESETNLKIALLQRKSTNVRDCTFDSIQEDEPEDLDDLLNKGAEGPDEIEDDLEESIDTELEECHSNTGNINFLTLNAAKKRQHDDGKSTASNETVSQNASFVSAPSTSSTKSKRLRQLNTQNDAQLSEVNRALDKLNNISRNVAKPDQFETYGRHVAAQLREIPIYNALVLMGKLDDIIRQERIQLLAQTEQNSVQNQGENGLSEQKENKGRPKKISKATEKPSSSNAKKADGETRLENTQLIFVDENGAEIPVLISNGSEKDLLYKALKNA